MNTLRDEVAFLLSGLGMPYAKVAIVVAVVVAGLFMIFFPHNHVEDGAVAVIDRDNSDFSREFIHDMDSSPYIAVTAVLNDPVDPRKLLNGDRNLAVVYLPDGFEKNRYSLSLNNIGVLYDNINAAQTASIKAALNQLVAMQNMQIGAPQVQALGLNDEQTAAVMSSIRLNERNLFSPVSSSVNSTILGFLIFFSAMFFVFATLGIVSRLRLEGQLDAILLEGSPFDLLLRLLPYGVCLTVGIVVGLVMLRLIGDLTFAGNYLSLLLALTLLELSCGCMSILFGWSAANPGVAASKMILFVPGGFIFGGQSGPFAILPLWAHYVCHAFPLVWEFRLVRDIILRGATFIESAQLFGGYMIYSGVLVLLVCLRFGRARAHLLREGPIRTAFDSGVEDLS